MRTHIWSISLTAMAVAMSASAAQAQQTSGASAAGAPPAPASTLAEVVVTAQKRSENVQNVPIAISAFTARNLQEHAIGNVSELANISPNVTLEAGTPFSGSSAVLAAYIRGIGSNDFAFNIDPGVGIYVDGVYLARTVGANQDLLDVQRVEILKGPQGTLFGRNTIGGAISIVTRDPGNTFKFTGDVTTGSFNLMQVRGSADVPIVDGLNSSITFSMKKQDGYLKRIAYPGLTSTNGGPAYTTYDAAGYGSSPTEGGDDDWSLRLKAKYDRGGHLKVTASVDYTDNDSTTANKVLGIESSLPGNFAGTTNLPGTAFDPTGLTGFNFAGLYNFCIGATTAQIAARNAQALCGVVGTQYHPGLQQPALAGSGLLPYDSRFLTHNVDTSYATGNDFSRLQNWGGAITADLALADNLSLRSITAYRGLNWTSGINASGSPLNIGDLSFAMRQQQFSQELQLLGSAFGKTLNYVLGGYYFDEGGSLHDFVTLGEGLVQIDGPNQLATQNGAMFGQVDWRPIDLVGFTLGGRYTVEAKTFTGGQQDLDGFDYKLFGCANASGVVTPNAAFPLAPVVTCQEGIGYPNANNPLQLYPPAKNHRWFSNFAPKLGIQLHPAPHLMAYASYSEGYKSGGWTTRLTNPLSVAPTFNPETAHTWEVGLKSQWLDRRLQLNVAAFSTAYNGIQLNFQEGTSPTIANAGDARIEGFEVETVAALAPGLTVTASTGYLHAYYTSVLPGVQAVSGADAYQAGVGVGAPLPETPHWKANLSPRYELTLHNGARLLLVADYTFTDASWNDAQRTYLLSRAASNMVNASLTYAEPQGRWSVTAGGTNLADDRYVISGDSDLALGEIFGTYDRPREGYVRFSVKY